MELRGSVADVWLPEALTPKIGKALRCKFERCVPARCKRIVPREQTESVHQGALLHEGTKRLTSSVGDILKIAYLLNIFPQIFHIWISSLGFSSVQSDRCSPISVIIEAI